ncbi:udp-glucose 4-epimerase [hydrocarbon metagenome]|uniref:Udp-glucose 4-epimerase n=1 Tax=hydrocarbon metagenome TaxID=938273 RepID=A0A0W8FX47_9ZZZZ
MYSTSVLPAIIITGASGLIGRNLLSALKNDFRIFAIARRSQKESNVPQHSNIAWMRADITDLSSLTKIFREIKTAGGADYLIHLAAYYDFENVYHPEYRRTNIEGTQNVITVSKDLHLKLFIFASSVAACSFPDKDEFIDENSPADGTHIYARSKKAGENLVTEFSHNVPTCIIRLGAVFTDWCEYAPLYLLINTWIKTSLRAKIIAGKGESAVPYIHIRDVIKFICELLANTSKLSPGEILIASTENSTTHLQLFKKSTRYYFGEEKKPLHVPKIVCALGIYLLNFLNLFAKKKLYERPWMIKYIDKKLNIKLRTTPEIINWKPDRKLHIEKRLPFLIEKMKSEPISWQIRNTLFLKKSRVRVDFIIYNILTRYEELIINNAANVILNNYKNEPQSEFFRKDEVEIKWFIKLICRLLVSSIDHRNKLLIQNYFEISGLSRFQSGYQLEEIVFLLKTLEQEVVNQLSKNEQLQKHKNDFYDLVILPIEFAIDEAEQQFDNFTQNKEHKIEAEQVESKDETKSARELLEETIWSCLVNRK